MISAKSTRSERTTLVSYHFTFSCAEFRDLRMTGNSASLIVSGLARIRIDSMVEKGPPMIVKASKLPYLSENLDEITMKAYSNELLSYVDLLMAQNPLYKQLFASFEKEYSGSRDPLYLANLAGYMPFAKREDLQKLLEASSMSERLDLSVKVFNAELQLMQLQKDLKARIEKATKENERKYFLHEQLKAIQKEMGGDKDPKQNYLNMVNAKLEQMRKDHVSPAAIAAVEEEVQRLSFIDIQHAEFDTTQNYINWVINLPWTQHSEDQMNIQYAQQVLNDDHYGLKDVKDRILEFIAVGKLQGHIAGKVLCFVGPPGTGKTSIAKSIARALGREYCQFSVGGANDVAQIKGHRRTYIGSLPGKIIWCMKKAKVNNPLILIDEVDKISASRNVGFTDGRKEQGDPASALLEVLDPNQNKEFLDTYLDIPFDLSNVLFICTANDLSTVPQPLLDRMEVIRVSGYDYQEKLEISKRFLDKKVRIATGLEPERPTTPKSLAIADDALQSLIRWYCREAGVRNLEKSIEKIYRKVAMRLATMSQSEIESTDFTIHAKDLEQYIGQRIFLSDRLYEVTPPGVVMGLAWTSMGGATLYIESQTIRPHPLDTTLPPLRETLPASLRSAGATSSNGTSPSSSQNTGQNGQNGQNNASINPPNGSLNSEFPLIQPQNASLIAPSEPAKPSTGHLTMTGQLGDVMKESIQIAYLNARRWMQRLARSDALYDRLTQDLHMHLPEGATPKDGPSAGCAITTSLLSLALQRPVRQGLAMTGEISLNGKVLPVGGIKEKVMAARRAGVNEIILPKENRRDVNELPEYIKENLTIHYASMYEDVLKFTDLCPEVFENSVKG
ncbi:uncharacterized protein [Blastocystis hominis]|uniref:Lon protease homolog n=1 Tax=Blastocystis hominis TaxID=12968 RepID=D8LUX7_BLAHO|nr:uncharacterized protein [Blastocystis hominis]CBK19616.2 unnamed protein product [Blastocystis hominis]|eukprot:XP_012893664.1 uncharacterized protein [Blastocystis hominis]